MALGREVGLGPLAPPPPKRGHRPPIFGPCLLWPYGWMDQDATLYHGGRLRPRPHCARWEPSSSPKKGHSPQFSARLLWPNGWMDHDTTWYVGRPRPRPHCITWGSSSPQKGHIPLIFGPCLLWPNGRPSQPPLSTCCFMSPLAFLWYFAEKYECMARCYILSRI